jgi:F-type H+-transporting ATPase subunit gamma
MASNKQALKSRIRSVKATKKITSAMELIATSKLQKQKNLMEANRLYSSTLHKTIHNVIGSAEVDDIPYLKPQSAKSLNVVFVSDMGLCGGYNSNIVHYLSEILQPDDPLVVVGPKERAWFKRNPYPILKTLPQSDNLTFRDLAKLGDWIMDQYKAGVIGGIRVVYTKFVNSMTFTPASIELLPIVAQEIEKDYGAGKATIFEPDPVTLIHQLVPMYMHSLLFGLWLEAKTAEQASRRMAMDNATDNAEELIEELLLEYNQSRQAAITQEITEIVSGAEAL